MADELLTQATRIADSLEKLASEPSFIEMEPAPPICPHCQAVDPQLIVESENGTGPASEFVLEAICGSCQRPVYGVVNHWILHPSVDEATKNVKYIHERQGKLNVVGS